MSEASGSWTGARRPVFILGAGFSKAIARGMPLSDELGQEVERLLEQREHRLPAELTKGTFEEWLSRLAEDQPDLLEHENLRRRAWFAEIAQAVAEVIERQQREIRSDGYEPPAWLRSFIGAAHGWRATVITFNYDTLLEDAVNRSYFRDFDAPGVSNRVRSCDVLGHLPPSADAAEAGPYSTFHLLKLHGSVNFYRASGDGVGSSLERWPLEGETHREHVDPLQESMTRNIAEQFGLRRDAPLGKVEDPSERKARVLFGYETFIVPPAALKSPYYRSTFLRSVWRRAREAIERASKLYLVGYSLPETDLVTVGLIRESLPAGASVFVVNRPGEDGVEAVLHRAQRLLGRGSDAIVEALRAESQEAVEAWAKDMAGERSREVPVEFVGKLEELLTQHRNDLKVKMTLYLVDRKESWPLEVEDQDRRTGDGVPYQGLVVGKEVELDPEKVLSVLKEYVTAKRPIAVEGDQARCVVIDAHVRPPAVGRYRWEVRLQAVPGAQLCLSS